MGVAVLAAWGEGGGCGSIGKRTCWPQAQQTVIARESEHLHSRWPRCW